MTPLVCACGHNVTVHWAGEGCKKCLCPSYRSPDRMTAASNQVRRIHTANGAYIEPPLDDSWDDLTKLSWHLAVTLLDAGLPQTGMVVRLMTGGTGPLDDFPMYELGIPGYRVGPLSYTAMWDVINGVEFGARAAQAAGGHLPNGSKPTLHDEYVIRPGDLPSGWSA